MMQLIEQSISVIILILFIAMIRLFFLHKLPKIMFQAMWAVVFLRLLIPFSIPVSVQIPQLSSWVLGWIGLDGNPEEGMENGNLENISAGNIGNNAEATDWQPGGSQWDSENTWNPAGVGTANLQEGTGRQPEASPEHQTFFATLQKWVGNSLISRKPVMAIWLAGAVLLLAYFIVTHIKCRRMYASALPLDSATAKSLLLVKFRRKVQLKVSDRIFSPLTYGLFSPVILLPKETDWNDEMRLRMVLAHEAVHILRFDVLCKWLMVVAVCIHWMNPFVWVAYLMANRDIELSCDEAVVRHFEKDGRQDYALALLAFEEHRGAVPALGQFSGNAVKERIVAIMKWRKTSAISIALAVILVAGTMTVFAVTNGKEGESDQAGKGISGNGQWNTTWFGDFAAYLSEEGEEKIYAASPDDFELGASFAKIEQTSKSGFANYFAIYDNTIYYVDPDIHWWEMGEVPDGKCRIMSRPLTANDEEATELVSLEDVAYFGAARIYQGLLYYAYETVEGESKEAIVDLEKGVQNEIHRVEENGIGYPIVAYDSEWIYYRSKTELFRADYQGENMALLHEFTQFPELLTMAGGKFYAVCLEDGEISLISMEKSGENKKTYQGFQDSNAIEFSLLRQDNMVYLAYGNLIYQMNEETAEVQLYSEVSVENAEIGYIVLKEGNENHLYFVAYYDGSAEEDWNNTMLMRIDRKDRKQEICGKWYTP